MDFFGTSAKSGEYDEVISTTQLAGGPTTHMKNC